MKASVQYLLNFSISQAQFVTDTTLYEICRYWNTQRPELVYLLKTGRTLKVRKTFRSRHESLLNVLSTFNLRPVSKGYSSTFLLLNYIILVPGGDLGHCEISLMELFSLFGTKTVLKISKVSHGMCQYFGGSFLQKLKQLLHERISRKISLRMWIAQYFTSKLEKQGMNCLTSR